MYTLILLSSHRDAIRQHTISQGHILLLSCFILLILLAVVSGIGYGLFQKYQSAKSEKELQVSTEEFKQLVEAKLQIESELAAVNEEMSSIRRMTKEIQETLGILGQGGGDSNITGILRGAGGQTELQEEDASVITDNAAYAHKIQGSLIPSILKQEVHSLYDYVSEYQKQIDEYPSILPVKLQQTNGEKYVFWYSSGFGRRTHPLTKKREFHRGLDIKTRAGLPVIAAADGTVVKAGKSGYLGNIVEIVHDAPQFKTLYAHLKGYVDGLKVGQSVTRGQIIGYVGNTGRSTGAHLHYGVYDEQKKVWVNPLAYIFDQKPTFSP